MRRSGSAATATGSPARASSSTKREAWDQYRLFAIYAWVSSTSTAGVGDRWQTEAVGRGGMARATAAVDDLDAVAHLEARLAGTVSP